MSLLMLYYNAICLRRAECFYITFVFWLSLKGRDLANVIVWRLIGIVLMTVLYFLMTVFSYSKCYRWNCITYYAHIYHQFIFVERGLMGEGGELSQGYIILGGGFAKLLYNVIRGRRGVKKSTFFCYIVCEWPPTDTISQRVSDRRTVENGKTRDKY